MAGPRVAPERAEQLARWLVEESVRVQEELGEVSRVRKTGSNILVVGGAGAMGRWLSDFFRSGGHEVAIFDPKARKGSDSPYRVHRRLGPAVRWADIIVVATPMGSTKAVYRSITDAGGEAILVDILSIKAPILPEMRRARERGWSVSSVHPLFGPSTRTLSGRNLLVLDCGDREANVAVTDLFRRSSLTITELPIEEHDELMGTVLGLPHVVSLLFSTAATRAGRTGGELAKLSPTSFLREAEVARVVSNENPQLAFDIQSLNPASAGMYSDWDPRSKRSAGRRRAGSRGLPAPALERPGAVERTRNVPLSSMGRLFLRSDAGSTTRMGPVIVRGREANGPSRRRSGVPPYGGTGPKNSSQFPSGSRV